jgi:hypothetical protein
VAAVPIASQSRIKKKKYEDWHNLQNRTDFITDELKHLLATHTDEPNYYACGVKLKKNTVG